VPLFFLVKGEEREGIAKDLSLGGMFIETATPAPFGAEITIHASLGDSDDVLVLPGRVRWIRDGGMGIQFGLLGAVETHIITEIGQRAAT
jgi:type IV pilus assembly protein PilZ